MKPTIGRIVIYRLDALDKAKLKELGQDNPNNGADEAPAIVVRVWSDTCVNLKVCIDGPTDLWITSAAIESSTDSVKERRWLWPPRV